MQQTFELFLGILAIFAFLMMIGGVIGYLIMAIVAAKLDQSGERSAESGDAAENEDEWEEI